MHDAQGMEAAALGRALPGMVTSRVSASRRRAVSAFLQSVGAGGQLLLDVGAHFVGQLANDRPLFGGSLPHLLEYGGQLSLFAQKPDPELLELLPGLRGVERRGRLFPGWL